MAWAAEITFWLCLALVVYTYLLYPACVWLLSRLIAGATPPPEDGRAAVPRVTLLVAAHNEERVIERKIRNSLDLDYPRDRLEIAIASDGSSDATPEIVAKYAGKGVRLLDFNPRRGKSALLNSAIGETCGEILVLSDANTDYRRDAVRKLVRWFADPKINAVCGRLVLRDSKGGKNVDGLYWRYETFLKKCEGKLGALLGANGAIYAIRRDAYVPIPNNTIIDDLVLPLLSKLRHNGRIAYDPDAVGIEETPPTIGNEFRRRVRIGTGAYQSVPLLWRLLSPRYGWTAFSFFSHKVLRWMVPFFLLGMLASSVLLLHRPLLQGMVAAQAAIYAAAVAGIYLPGGGLPGRLVRTVTMFVGMNLALLFGFWHWLSKAQTGTWQRTTREQEAPIQDPAVSSQ